MKPTPNMIRLQHLLESFFTTWALMKISRLEPGNIFTVVFFLFSLFFYRHLYLQMKHVEMARLPAVRCTACILSLLFTTMYMMVDYREYIGTLSNFFFRLAILAAVYAGLYILFYKSLQLLFFYMLKKEWLMEKICTPGGTVAAAEENTKRFSGKERWILAFFKKHVFVCAAALCLVCWMPYFLYQYPGIITPDSLNQFEQAMGVLSYSNHHPWVHTMLIKLWYHIGLFFSDDLVTAFSFYTAFQMVVLACSIGYLVKSLAEFEVNAVVLLIVTSFYALVPYHAVYSVTVWKDIPFAAGVLAFSCSLVQLSGKRRARDMIIYFLSGLVVCLFRTNGWYGFLVCLPFLIYHFRKRLKVMLPLNLLIVVAAVIVKVPVMNACSVEQPDFVESISVPIQQVAYVVCSDRTLTEEQKELVEKIVDTTYIKDLYVSTFADNMKELVRAGHPEYLESHKKEYLGLWFELLRTYPMDYIQAYIWQTYGYWYPDSFYPVADNEGVSATELGVSHTPLIGGPLVVKGKEISLKLGGMVPLYGILWSMGIATWILLFCMGSAFVRQEKEKLVFYLPGFALLMTVLVATPVASDFRYLYFLFLTLPLYLFIAVYVKRQ